MIGWYSTSNQAPPQFQPPSTLVALFSFKRCPDMLLHYYLVQFNIEVSWEWAWFHYKPHKSYVLLWHHLRAGLTSLQTQCDATIRSQMLCVPTWQGSEGATRRKLLGSQCCLSPQFSPILAPIEFCRWHNDALCERQEVGGLKGGLQAPRWGPASLTVARVGFL